MKNKKSLLVIFIITALILYITLKDNFLDKIKYIFSFNPLWLLLAFALIIAYWFLKALVLYYCTNKVDKTYPFWKALYLMVTTQFFHAITPFSSGGQPWQIYTLKKDGIEIEKSTNIILQDFIVYQIALILIGLIAIISNHIWQIFPQNGLLKKLVLIGFTLNLLVTVALFILAFSKKWNKKILNTTVNILGKLKIIKDKEKYLNKTEEYIDNFHKVALELINDKKYFIKITSLNLFALTGLYLIPFTLAMGLGIYLNPLIVIVTSAYVMLIGSMVPIPGGTGGLEYGFLSFYKTFIKEPILSSLMIVWRIVTYYFGVLLGAIILNIKRKWENAHWNIYRNIYPIYQWSSNQWAYA